jgi:hypothetical protein
VNCSGCHDGTDPQAGGLDLRHPATDVAGLVGQPARGTKCAPAGRPLLEPGGTGLLLDKLRPTPPCGDRMPQGTYPFTEDEIACVSGWLSTVSEAR